MSETAPFPITFSRMTYPMFDEKAINITHT